MIKLDNKRIPIHFKSNHVAVMVYYWAHNGGYGTADDIVRACNLRHCKKRAHAVSRGIAFELTADQHFKMLLADHEGAPVFTQIGKKAHELSLQRYKDNGDYVEGNCAYHEVIKNLIDSHKYSININSGEDNHLCKYRYFAKNIKTGRVTSYVGNVELAAAGFDPHRVSALARTNTVSIHKGHTFTRELLERAKT